MGRSVVLRAPPPEQAAVFHQVNPTTIFHDIEEIGKGNFGSVYKATKEGKAVAIKIMKVPQGFESDTWTEIYKEIVFMSSIEHEHVIAYYGCYLQDLSVWLTMEYAIGSAQDVMDVFKAPFKENEIAEVMYCVVQALQYLHHCNKIHRDIKAGNILLTEVGTVKLGDFGSASTRTPANTLIGTPYWMAPELIMAMETGTYGCSADIWSLGITAIELAQRKPPLFELNAMTALYHIPQKDPPTLNDPAEWSAEFVKFVALCLVKDPDERANAVQLLQHSFIRKPRPVDVLAQLVERTKSPELQQENAAALDQLIKSAADFVVSPTPPEDTSSPDISSAASREPSTPEELKPGPNPEPEPDFAQKTQKLPTPILSSTIKSPTQSPKKKEVVGVRPRVSATSDPATSTSSPNRHQLTSIPEPEGDVGKGGSSLQVARATRWQNERGNAQNQTVVSQLKEIRKLRGEMIKQMDGLNSKHEAESTKQHVKTQAELDRLRRNKEKELEKQSQRCRSDMEQYSKQEATELRKFIKMRKEATEKAWAAFKRSTELDYKRAKATMDLDSPEMSKDERKTQKEGIKEQHALSKKTAEAKLTRKLAKEDQVARIEFDLSRLPLLHAIKFRHLEEEVELIIKSNNEFMATKEHRLVESHQLVRDHLHEQSTLQDSHLAKLVETEQRQAMKIQRDAVKSMKKRHLSELKMQPKELKAGEQKIKRMFTDSIRITEKRYNTTAKALVENVSKAEQESALSKHDAQKSMRLSQLQVEYQKKLAEMKEGATSATAKNHLQDEQDLEHRNSQESSALKNYQITREKKQVARMKKKLKMASQQEEKDLAEVQQLKAKMAMNNEEQTNRLRQLQQKQSKEVMTMQQLLSDRRTTSS